ncbi:MAG TPA: hypothetical protein VN881_06925 [Candidatus Acidoferrales bacterium]|nr:hypothetical protein [Candidatus Acidoferrales bacterium]
MAASGNMHNFPLKPRIEIADRGNLEMLRTSALAVGLLLMCANVFAQSSASKTPPNTSPQPSPSLAHDTHEGMTVLADAYDEPARAKDKFGKADPIGAGILPVEVFLRNESDHPIRVDLNTIRLEVHFRNGDHQDIDSMRPSDAAYLIAHPQGPSGPKNPRIPSLSLPGGDKKSAKIEDILRPLALDADVVPPMATIHGFLYFDLSRDMSLAGASVLYVPDAAVIPGNKPLMFFEVPLAKAPQD